MNGASNDGPDCLVVPGSEHLLCWRMKVSSSNRWTWIGGSVDCEQSVAPWIQVTLTFPAIASASVSRIQTCFAPRASTSRIALIDGAKK